MDNEQKFWLLIWMLAAGCLCTLILSITAFNVINMMQMNDAIAHAPDPVAMSCAMGLQASCLAKH